MDYRRFQALEEAHFTCAECGGRFESEDLRLHHNTPTSLVVLCKICHEKQHTLDPAVKVHRVRLSTEEVHLIAKALGHFYDLVQGKGLLTYPERRILQDLAIRFEDWGEDHGGTMRPMYKRTRTRREG